LTLTFKEKKPVLKELVLMAPSTDIVDVIKNQSDVVFQVSDKYAKLVTLGSYTS